MKLEGQRIKLIRQRIAQLSLVGLTLSAANTAHAHASDQGLVLLLPTNVYITSGVLAVVLTIVLLAFLPASWTHKLFNTKGQRPNSTSKSKTAINATNIKDTPLDPSLNSSATPFSVIPSLVSTLFLLTLLWIGFTGSHDPLENPMPLFIWTLWWIGFVIFQGLFGNLWLHLNPWVGLYRLIQHIFADKLPLQLSSKFGSWPGVVSLLLFMSFALADTAPDAPARLAVIVWLYWLCTLLAMIFYGEQWLCRGECFSMLLKRYAQLAPLRKLNNGWQIGVPGWHAFARRAMTTSSSVFILVLLGSGSFDGLNETFSWLAFIGVNPLEFPGRSAVIGKTIAGLIGTCVLLIAVYGFCIFVGTNWANKQKVDGRKVGYKDAFCQLSIAILPIAFAYHFAHFLTAFMINSQYALAAASDPFDTGADFLNLGTFYVTTGFMNSHHTVETIWLMQAASVVIGHILSVMLAHAIALDLFGSARRAIISQAPLAAFMVLYTLLGLWLLAAPRGA